MSYSKFFASLLVFLSFSSHAIAGYGSAYRTKVVVGSLVEMIRYHQSGAILKISNSNTDIELSNINYNIEPNKSCLALLSSVAAVDGANKKINIYFQYSRLALGSGSSLDGTPIQPIEGYSNVQIRSCIVENI